ncbi:hypothetical protein CMV_023217, partial [Castanea mollissima]
MNIERPGKAKGIVAGRGSINLKREGPTPIDELDTNIIDLKRRKGKTQAFLAKEADGQALGSKVISSTEMVRTTSFWFLQDSQINSMLGEHWPPKNLPGNISTSSATFFPLPLAQVLLPTEALMVLNSQTMDVSMTKLDYYEDKLKLHSNATLLSYIK